MKKFLNSFLLPILILLFGICLGVIIKDFPKFKLIYEIKISDALQNIITLGVGVFVPIIIKKIIDDSRSIKSTLLNEIDNYEEQLNKVLELFQQCYQNKKLTQINKENINLLLELTDSKLDSLKSCLSDQLPNKLKTELNKITELQNCVWKKLTGQSISPKRVIIIDIGIFNELNKIAQELHTSITKLKTQIHKI